jgi:hypothetical protein
MDFLATPRNCRAQFLGVEKTRKRVFQKPQKRQIAQLCTGAILMFLKRKMSFEKMTKKALNF